MAAATKTRAKRSTKAIADMINHPPHYTFGEIEVLDAIEDWDLEYHEACIVKYVTRAKHKGDRLENLRKAQFYLNRKIELLESYE